jgi:uncharacterized membrane protein
MKTERLSEMYTLAYGLVTEIFKVSLFSYLVFYLVDTLIPHFFSDYFNISILLTIALLAGILTILLHDGKKESGIPKVKRKSDYVLAVCVSVLVGAIVYAQFPDQGLLTYVITLGSILTSLGMVLLFFIFPDDTDKDKPFQL